MTAYRQRYGARNSAWRVIYPFLIYILLQGLAALAVATLLSALVLPQYFSQLEAGEIYGYMNAVMDLYMDHVLDITALSAAISIPLSLFMMHVDREERDNAGITTRWKQSWLPFLLMIVLGIAACYLGNVLVSISGVSEIGDENTIDLLAGNVYKEILFAGIVVPIAEELTFRALFYRRLHDYMGMIPAMFISAAVFGALHGTLANFLYAFALGLLLAWAYERFKNIWASIIIHMAANIMSVALTSSEGLVYYLTGDGLKLLISCVVSALLVIACVVIVETKVRPVPLNGRQE